MQYGERGLDEHTTEKRMWAIDRFQEDSSEIYRKSRIQDIDIARNNTLYFYTFLFQDMSNRQSIARKATKSRHALQ